jgi:uncharacterized protein (TIGR03435 family)
MATPALSKTNLGGKVVSLLAAAALAAPMVLAQAPLPDSQPAVAPVPAFEVVSIRPNNSGSNRTDAKSLPDRFIAENVGVADILRSAFHPTDGGKYMFFGDRLLGLPDWAKSEHYNIEATVADIDMAAFKSGDVRQLMFQSLLADRFHLKAHIETREQPMYQLVVAKNGPKLEEAAPGDTYANGIQNIPSGIPHAGICWKTGNGQITAQGATIGCLADLLSLPFVEGTLVLDKTGLAGNYDFTVKWSIDDRTGQPFLEPDISWGVPAPRDLSGISLSTALQQQLGLKLESTRGPVQVLVVDKIERPTEN